MSRVQGKVLLVDDEAQDLEYYGQILRACGYDVIQCESYSEGLGLLAHESFHCIIVSQGTPAFEGKILIEGAVESNRNLPVLVITRCHNIQCYIEAMQLGAVDYLEKPVAQNQIQWVMETHVRRPNVTA